MHSTHSKVGVESYVGQLNEGGVPLTSHTAKGNQQKKYISSFGLPASQEIDTATAPPPHHTQTHNWKVQF